MKNMFAIVGVVLLVVVAAVGGFFAGNSFGPNAQAQNIQREFFAERFGNAVQGGAPNGPTGQGGQNAQGGPGAQPGRRPIAFGTVKSVQGDTIQITMQDGTIVTITTDSKTVVEKTVAGAVADVQIGQRITVMGSQTGGDMVATQISIQPSGPGAP